MRISLTDLEKSQIAQGEWIAGRVATLLSHYFQPDNPQPVQDEALVDWVKQLTGYSEGQIEGACQLYLRNQPRRRPTPGDVLAYIRSQTKAQKDANDKRAELSLDERELLETKILPTARRWLDIPGLREHGEKTLAHWGEI